MEKHPVSIVMTSYNRVDLARRTLRSIFAQEYPVEVILVDDGSVDDTKVLASEFPIKYIYLDRPYYCNQSRAMNLGIRNSTNDIIILQSSEVEHQEKNTIERLVNSALEDEKRWTFARVANVKDGQILEYYTGTVNPRPFFFLCSLRKKFLEEIRGLDEDFAKPGYDDNDLADRLINGCGLSPVFDDTINGWHYDHPRPVLPDPNADMCTLYQKKTEQWSRKEITHVRNLNREWGAA